MSLQVLTVPCRGPRRNRPLADCLRRVRDHRRLGHLIDTAKPMALRTCARRRVRRERLRVEVRLPARICPRPRVEHPQQIGQGRDTADRRTCGRRSALLLQRDGRRETVDLVDLGDAHLVEQPPRIRRDRFQIPPLRLRVERAEGERRLPRSRHAGEDDQGIAWNLDVHVLEVVLARPANTDEAGEAGHGPLHAAQTSQEQGRQVGIRDPGFGITDWGCGTGLRAKARHSSSEQQTLNDAVGPEPLRF